MGIYGEIRSLLLTISIGLLTGSIFSLLHVLLEKEHYRKPIEHFSDRFEAKFGDKISKATKRIYVFTTNLEDFLNYSIEIEKTASKRNIDIKLLILQPNSKFGEISYRELKFEDKSDFFTKLNSSLDVVKQSKKRIMEKNPRVNFEIKTYLFMPTVVMYLIDDKLHVNPIIPFHKGRDCVHISYDIADKRTRAIASDYLRAFRSCWDNATPLCDDVVFDSTVLKTLCDETFGTSESISVDKKYLNIDTRYEHDYLKF